MSLATIDVWVSALDDPCKVSDRNWYITVYNCDGSVLKWCGREYAVLRAPCGHRTLRVPPGCYRINAVWSFSIGDGFYRVNHFTDSVVVQACCDKHTCVTLFNPEAHRCGVIFLAALRDAALQDGIPKALLNRAEDTMKEVLEALPRPVRPFELGRLEEFEKRVREQEERGTLKEDFLAFDPSQDH